MHKNHTQANNITVSKLKITEVYTMADTKTTYPDSSADQGVKRDGQGNAGQGADKDSKSSSSNTDRR